MVDEKLTKNIGLRGVTVADSAISLVDGIKGRLLYRGFSIQELAAKTTYEEIVHLLLTGEAASPQDIQKLSQGLAEARTLPDGLLGVLRDQPAGASSMDVAQAVVSLLAAYDDDLGADSRPLVERSCLRLISRFATAMAAWQRLRQGGKPHKAQGEQSHAAAFLRGVWGRNPTDGEARLMDLLLILHAEHSFNASTFAVREVASTQAHLYAAVSAGVGALSGPLHGGANARVMRMLLEIERPERVASWVDKRLEAGERVMGLGHAVYRTEDPRAAILRKTAAEVLAGSEAERWFHLALEVERVARTRLKEKKGLDLYPNVDFYSAPVLYGLGFPMEMFPALFAVSRVAGWCAHFIEEHFAEVQPKPALYRPRAHYVGRLCGTEACPWEVESKR